MFQKEKNRISKGIRLGSILLLLFLCISFMGSRAWAASNDKYYSILNSMQNDLSYAQTNYELSRPSYTPMNRKAETPLTTIKNARYKKGKDGIYRSSSVKKDNVAVIMLTGDLMCQKKQQWEAQKKYGRYEFTDNFTYVKHILSSSDFTIGNLETMLSESASYFGEEARVDGKPHCNAPSTFLDAVRGAGFDMVVTANNHDCDTGVQGIFETIGHLDQYQLLHTGTFTNKEQKRYIIVEIDGIKVGFLSYASMYNSKDSHFTPEGKQVLLNPYSKKQARKDIKAARNDGAEYIITYIHWGIEYNNDYSQRQKTIAKELADAGTDYIAGSHSHCLQPYGSVTSSNGKKVPVIYSMGNFVSQMQARSISQESMILKIKLKRNSKGKVVLKSDGYIPCRIMPVFKGNNYTCLPLTSPYNKGHSTKYAKECYPHITQVISSRLNVMGQFPIKKMVITQEYKSKTYTGKAITPKITVKDALGKTLKLNKDYTISRGKHVLPGISTITVKGKGHYMGSWKTTLTIKPRKVKNFKVTTEKKNYRFSWKEDKGLDGYYIYVKEPGYNKYRKLKSTKNPYYTFKTKGKMGQYQFRVVAYKKTKDKTLRSPKSKEITLQII